MRRVRYRLASATAPPYDNADMRDPEPVIELEPKSPFRWKVFLVLVLLWGLVLVLAVELKSNLLRMIWPALLFVMVVYLAVCTFLILKNRK